MGGELSVSVCLLVCLSVLLLLFFLVTLAYITHLLPGEGGGVGYQFLFHQLFLPVFIWIHGGSSKHGNNTGDIWSDDARQYDGRFLALQENIGSDRIFDGYKL